LGYESSIFAAGAGAVVARHQRGRFGVSSVVFTGAIAPTSDHDLVSRSNSATAQVGMSAISLDSRAGPCLL